MIKLENVVTASPEQMAFIIEGMRNPLNSWGKSDSWFYDKISGDKYNIIGDRYPTQEPEDSKESTMSLGNNDLGLMQRLAKAGTDHRKFMRMMPVYVRITAPLYWWKEFDTYKVGTVANSCSTMHKIQSKEFSLDDFSCEHLVGGNKVLYNHILKQLNDWRYIYLHADDEEVGIEPPQTLKDSYNMSKKDIWWQMIQLLPSTYNQTRNVMMNYEVLANMYHSRKNHKLDEWVEFCKWIETLPYSELVIGERKNDK